MGKWVWAWLMITHTCLPYYSHYKNIIPNPSSSPFLFYLLPPPLPSHQSPPISFFSPSTKPTTPHSVGQCTTTHRRVLAPIALSCTATHWPHRADAHHPSDAPFSVHTCNTLNYLNCEKKEMN
ncbi:hypothetical protein GUJ93_ZPchr0005g14914 [Zizania palustris]|uniref:Secreted protein n=1 Tax=Zizania palustris TaxID=103762 RepID=A0A8J5VGE8_ZIZPA|nr:hypothetical protein GUJ93_ZPchr0005g14914 [Zizania palustris]